MPRPQPLLVVSAILLVACGIGALFAPQEIGALLGGGGAPGAPIAVQLLGAALFALGLLDWYTRFSTIGGIHGRPVLLANFAYFVAASMTLTRQALHSVAGPAWLAAGVTGVLAVGFALRLFRPPKRSDG
jgi:hypothetical protein